MSLKVGIQLYSVRESMKVDPLATLEKVAQIGYRNIEVANHSAATDFGVGFGVEASKLNEIFGRFGAHVVSAHIWPFNDDNCRRSLAYNLEIGNRNIVHAIDFFKDEDEVLRKCEFFNRMGAICREEGVQYLYHNHFHEFQKFNGKPALEIIRDNTDPSCVNFELDTFWTMRAGLDPIEVIRNFGTRIRLLHQKDFSRTSTTPVNLFEVVGENADITMEVFGKSYSHDDFTEIGTGLMDIQKIIDTANEIGSVSHIILEQDYTQQDPLESIRISMEAFKRFNGIEWN